MNQFMHILADEFVNAFIGQSAKTCGVAESAAAFEVNSINRFGSRVEKYTEFILTLAQCIFRLLMVGDVRHHAYHIQHPAIVVEEGLRVFLQPNNRTIGTQHAIAHSDSRVLGTKLVNRTDKQSAVVGMDPSHELLASKRLCQAVETDD